MTTKLKQNYDAAFYANQKAGSRASAGIVLETLSPIVGEVGSVLDVGCGAGGWLKAASEIFAGADIFGVDHPGVPEEEMFIPRARFAGHDLTAPIHLKRRFDLVISLEVAEHIPPEKAPTFIDTLADHGDVVMFSAAVPRQGGTGHVNEQWPDYWIALFEARGMAPFDVLRPLIWDDDDVSSWYKQNILLFARHPERLNIRGLEDWRGRALIHPGSWMRKTEPVARQVTRLIQGRKPDHNWRVA
jgi:SAM-dependent methyltransferase